jgi:hypothetical protein
MRLGSTAVSLALAVTVVTGCTTEDHAPPAAGGSTAATDSARPPEEVGEVPLAPGGDYQAAADVFGADQVTAAVEGTALVAHIALADCHRWTTGEVDPRLHALVTSELMARSLDELDQSRKYGGLPVPSLLSHLPDDDGNGNDETSAVGGGCDDSAPLRFPNGPVRVQVHRGGDHPLLEVTGEYVTEVTFGSTRVGAGQDWTFLSEPTADGWLVMDADVVANVNWFPAPPA